MLGVSSHMVPLGALGILSVSMEPPTSSTVVISRQICVESVTGRCATIAHVLPCELGYPREKSVVEPLTIRTHRRLRRSLYHSIEIVIVSLAILACQEILREPNPRE